MTIIRPAPGVMSGFDEYGCAVVDTRGDRWIYLEGERAWVWETVRITGGGSHLEPEDFPHLDFFVKSGLMQVNPTVGHEEEVVESSAERFTGPALLHACTPWMIRKCWNQSLRLSRLPMIHTLDLVTRTRRRTSSGWPSRRAVERLQSRIMETPTRWPHRKTQGDGRTLAVATVLCGALVDARIDIGFGVRHGDRSQVWWCSTPEGPVGRPDRSLCVAIM